MTCVVRHPARPGFTLLELILVMVIAAIAMALVAPQLRGFGDRRRTEDEATQMLLLIRWARQQAVAEARPYRFNVDVDDGVYYLTAQTEGRFERVASDYGRRFTLPTDMTVEWIEPRRGGGDAFIRIEPTGLVEPGRIRLVNSEGSSFDLVSEAAAEPYRLESTGEGSP